MGVAQTSFDIFKTEIEPTLGERQNAVLEVMEVMAPAGDSTNTEISEMLGWSINRVTPRIFELRSLGKVGLSQKRLCTITKRRVMAWKLIK